MKVSDDINKRINKHWDSMTKRQLGQQIWIDPY